MLKSLFRLLFPETCCGCDGILLENEAVVCTQCRHDMPFTQHHLNPENETYKKFYGRLPLQHASSMLYFHKKGIVQQLVHNLKYRGRKEIGELMGQWYMRDLETLEALRSVTDVIPVPLHKKRLRKRGYNQVDGFAKCIAEGLKARYNEDILYRKLYSKTQTKKNVAARTEISEAFEARYQGDGEGRHFLLVDDVVTSGATLEACGRVLLKIPGAKLSIVTIAYAHS